MTAAFVVPRISIVMPCLNEAETVATCVAKALAWLKSSGVPGEVLVVDNGSTDRSAELATAAGAQVIRERRRGYGNAYLRGFAEARGEIIVMGDADDTYDFSQLDALIEPLEQGYDMVVGNRFTGGVEPGAMPWAHRYIGSPIINLLIRRFIGVRIGDSQSGFRAFTRVAYQRLTLRSGGMELASEMIVNAAREGLRIAEVPAPYNVRLGESKLNTVRDGWRHLRFLLISAPNFLFVLPGLALLGMGLVVTTLSFLAPSGVEVG
jgi:glycosyltransferase involved in cell wall biosynthesis